MSDVDAVDPAKRFVCGIATGTAAGYPDDAYDLILRRIKDCVDVPGLVVTRWRYNSALEVYADVISRMHSSAWSRRSSGASASDSRPELAHSLSSHV